MSKTRKWHLRYDWVIIVVVIVGVAFMLFYPLWARAQTAHQKYHDDFYQKWTTAEGNSCCNSKAHAPNGDCAPIDANRVRTRGEKLEVLVEDEWVEVAQDKIRPFVAPDMSNHLCHKGKQILCFVSGAGI